MTFGLDSTGFSLKRLADIKEEVENTLKASFGEIATGPDSVFGQIIGVLSKQYADLWELGQQVYNSQYPSSAYGFSLENVVQFVGLSRLPATATRVLMILEGDEGTIVPEGQIVSAAETSARFAAEADVTITKENVLKCIVSIDNVTIGASYTISIRYPISAAPIASTYTAISGDTAATVATGLVLAINTLLGTYVTALDNANGTLTIEVDDSTTAIAVNQTASVPSAMSFAELWTPAFYSAEETGEILALAGTITQIETAISGLNAVDNLLPGVVGRALETDTELRLRRAESLQSLGAATPETIRSRLRQEVEDIISVSIVENLLDVAVAGRPGHSFETIVEGGDDDEIAAKLWLLKPAGIQTYGNVNSGLGIDTPDSQGNLQNIKFSRPVSIYSWCYVEITRYLEETFPTNGVALIIEAIRNWGTTLGIGKDVIVQRVNTPIFDIPGVKTADIWLFTSMNPSATPTRPVPPTGNDYNQTTHAIDANEISVWSFSQDVNNIEVADIT